uniref:Uncharacterized protein n=1 Tax=Arundo donax TaxID=35708 RepID=A0A0A9DZF2_ARUDO
MMDIFAQVIISHVSAHTSDYKNTIRCSHVICPYSFQYINGNLIGASGKKKFVYIL